MDCFQARNKFSLSFAVALLSQIPPETVFCPAWTLGFPGPLLSPVPV